MEKARCQGGMCRTAVRLLREAQKKTRTEAGPPGAVSPPPWPQGRRPGLRAPTPRGARQETGKNVGEFALPIPSGLRPSPLDKGSRPLKGKAEGDRKGRPYGGMRTGSVCSVKPGAEQKPHRLKFWGSQGPVAREETQIATRILSAGNFTQPCRYASPVMGDRGPTPLVKGRWPKARGDREGEYGHEVSILSRPPAAKSPAEKRRSGPMRASGPTNAKDKET